MGCCWGGGGIDILIISMGGGLVIDKYFFLGGGGRGSVYTKPDFFWKNPELYILVRTSQRNYNYNFFGTNGNIIQYTMTYILHTYIYDKMTSQGGYSFEF